MRKLFQASIVLLCITLLAACDSKTSSLVGKWQMKKEKKEGVQSLKATYDLELKADKALVASIDIMVEGSQEGFSMRLPINMGFEGTWSVTNDQLKIKADSATTKIDIDKDKMEFKFDNPALEMMANQIKDLTFASMGPKAKIDVANQFISEEAMNYKLEGNQLLLISSKDTLVFKRQP